MSSSNIRFDLVAPGRPGSLGSVDLMKRTPPKGLHDLRASAPLYQVDAALADAINVALTLGAPLLVTGEPGTGKTQLAYWLAWYFGIEADVTEGERQQPFELAIKSTTVYQDLLYRFDTVAYFRDARVEGGALDKAKYVTKGPLWRAIEEVNAGRPAIVLLDEIDKAPRDFPNDLLRELDQFEFEVKETKERIVGEKNRPPPIVVATSNIEKALPPAFLRRCVFHHITVDEALLRRAIVAWRRVREEPSAPGPAVVGHEAPALNELEEAALQAFRKLREVDQLDKVPATAELLGWLTALVARKTEASELRGRLGDLPLLSVLIKDHEDLGRVRGS
jgi:MoxR-like ATPase